VVRFFFLRLGVRVAHCAPIKPSEAGLLALMDWLGPVFVVCPCAAPHFGRKRLSPRDADGFSLPSHFYFA
jgi:hypothetical protein